MSSISSKSRTRFVYAGDIHPRKHGMYIAKIRQKITSQEFLQTYKPDVVIVTNATYGAGFEG